MDWRNALLLVVWTAACYFSAIGSTIAHLLWPATFVCTWLANPAVAAEMKRPQEKRELAFGLLGLLVLAGVVFAISQIPFPPDFWSTVKPYFWFLQWLVIVALIIAGARANRSSK